MKIHGTAEGAALSTKDFGVAFSGGGANELTCETGDENEDNFVGQQVASGPNRFIQVLGFNPQTGNSFLDKTVDSITFYLKKRGSPTGNVTVKIYNASMAVQATSDTEIDSAADLSGSYAAKTFEFSSSFIITEDYTYGVVSSDGTNNWNDSAGVEPQLSDGITSTGNRIKYNQDTDNNPTGTGTGGSWATFNKTISVCFYV